MKQKQHHIMVDDLEPGKVFRGQYPFVHDLYSNYDGESKHSWKPGPKHIQVGPEGGTETVADGVGEIILTVISTHKPGHYPTRVFFSRKWKAPDGQEFGKTRCMCVTLEKFRRLARGYQHEYTVKKEKTEAA